jgi:hypothetical protein
MGGCETTPPDSRTDPGKPAPPADASSTANHNPAGFLTRDHRPPLAGVKLIRPRQRPDGRTGPGSFSCSWDPASCGPCPQLSEGIGGAVREDV